MDLYGLHTARCSNCRDLLGIIPRKTGGISGLTFAIATKVGYVRTARNKGDTQIAGKDSYGIGKTEKSHLYYVSTNDSSSDRIIVVVNGMNNTTKEAEDSAKNIAELSKNDIGGIYNSTKGIF